MNATFFPSSGAAKTALALAMNRINQFNTQLLLTERDSEVISSIVADIARANDITVNFMGFGSITSRDIQWVVEAHDRNELWHSDNWLDRCHSLVRLLLEQVLRSMVIWYDVNEMTWNVNLSDKDAMPSFEGNLYDAINFVRNTFAGNN